ncbi:MAG TPA: HD domain-containing phosphohydrolase [Solirubrobacterales bacterium]
MSELLEQTMGPAAAGNAAGILVTDDRPEVLRLIDRTLGSRYRCEFASSVDEAREKLDGTGFELALCDIQMPGESGLVLVEEIAARYPDMAIVLVTGVDDPDVAKQTFRLGAHGYLVKPFWPGQLLITTMNALRQRELELTEKARSRVLLESAEKRAEHFRDELALAQQQAIEELRSSRQETVERLARAIEMHDAETGRHVNRMASIAAFLGAQIGLSGERVLLLRAAAPMHDVGKIAIPDEILRKPGPLTPEEREQMETHTWVGHQILADSDSDLLRIGASIALTHHEWWDGSGYPQGLRGEEIPLEGRIVAVADIFDALLSDRPYRPAMTVDEAVKTIEDERGTHFDPRIADLLLEHLDEALSLRG